MKKIILSLVIFTMLIFFVSCKSEISEISEVSKDYSNYKNEVGYHEYINDESSSYEKTPFFNVEDTISYNADARKFYENNSRRVGDFLVTNYEDGICINKYLSSSYSDLIIPETLDGKPVVKLGGYLDNTNDKFTEVIGAFGGNTGINLIIPASVKFISSSALEFSRAMIPEDSRYAYVDIHSFEVDENNPYYSSKNGSLYSKDFKNLLWVNTTSFGPDNPEWDESTKGYTVPDFVEVFEPANGVNCNLSSITFGKNIKKIDAYIDKGEDGIDPDPDMTPYIVKVRGYKNTVAEEWAKEQYAEFEAIG